MSVNIKDGSPEYREKIEVLRLKYPLGIPAEEVILLCQDLEIYYLNRVIEDKTKLKNLTDYVSAFVNFSTN